MRKARKLTLTFMSILFALTFVLGLVACGGQSAKDAIEAYLLPQDNQLVDADFTLPKKIGVDNGVEVEWTSDNAAITIEEGTADAYNAKVTLQDTVTNVKLTVSSGSASKDFTVRVDELSVFTFMNHYGNDDYDETSFPQRKTAQKEDFTLDSSYTIQGKTATIAWEVKDAKDKTYLDVVKANDVQTAHVMPGDDLVKVKLTASFTYKEVTKEKDYEISVSPDLDHRQLVNKLYSEAGFPIEFEGYVVHVYTAANDSKYGPMASFYAVDTDFCSGYYIWQAKLESEKDVEKVKVGAHFTFSGDYTKNYNGLWESNGYEEGTAVFDGEGNKTAAEMEASIRAFDAELIAGTDSAKWQMSRLVSLSGWKVKTAWAADKNDNIYLTLTNGGTDIAVYSSTYVTTDKDALSALQTKLKGLTVGSFVDIKGILGYNNGYRLQPRTADDITAATAEGVNNGAKLKAAYEAVQAKVTTEFTGLITKAKANVQMPTTNIANAQGVTVSYRLAKKVTDGAPVVVGTDGKISVTPQAADKTCLIEVSYTIDEKVVAQSVFTIRSWAATPQAIIDEVYTNLNTQRITAIASVGEYKLPTTDTFGMATVTWTIGDDDHPAPEWAEIAGTKLVVNYLPAEAASLRLYAKVECTGGTAKTAFFNVKVSAISGLKFEEVETLAAGVDYVYGLYQANLGKWLYSTGLKDGNFGATTEDLSSAAKYVLARTDDGWTIKVNTAGHANDGKFLELNDSHQIVYVDKSTASWTWDDSLKVFTWTKISGKIYYIGTYNTFNTLSASETSYLSGSSTNFRAEFGTTTAMEDADKASDVLNISLPQFIWTQGKQISLPTYNAYAPANRIEWSITDGNTGNNATLDVSQDKKTATFTATTLPTEAAVAITLTAKTTVGTAENVTKTFTIKLVKEIRGNDGTYAHPFTPSEALILANALDNKTYSDEVYYVKGYVVEDSKGTLGWYAANKNWTFFLGDTNQTTYNSSLLEVFRLGVNSGKGLALENDLYKGAEITLSGKLQKYSNTLELSSDLSVVSYTDARSDAQKAQAAIDAIKNFTTTLNEDLTITSTVTGVTFTVTSENSAIAAVATAAATVTLKVTRPATTAEDVTGTVTIIAHCKDQTAQKTQSVTVEKQVPAKNYTKVTAATQLQAGQKIAFGVGALAMGGFKGTNTFMSKGGAVAENGGGYTLTDEQVFTLGGDATSGWTLTIEGKGKLYVTEDNNAKLGTADSPSANYTWDITIGDDGAATITLKDTTFSKKQLLYNSDADRFCNYGTGSASSMGVPIIYIQAAD